MIINGVTQLILTKSDVLSGFETIKVCTHYKINGALTDLLPYDVNVKIEPVYKEFKGWRNDITQVRTLDDMPVELLEYIKFIEKEVGVPVTIISVGPDRKQTVFKK